MASKKLSEYLIAQTRSHISFSVDVLAFHIGRQKNCILVHFTTYMLYTTIAHTQRKYNSLHIYPAKKAHSKCSCYLLPYHFPYDGSLRSASVTALGLKITLVAWISRGKQRWCVRCTRWVHKACRSPNTFLRATEENKEVVLYIFQRRYVYILTYVVYDILLINI